MALRRTGMTTASVKMCLPGRPCLASHGTALAGSFPTGFLSEVVRGQPAKGGGVSRMPAPAGAGIVSVVTGGPQRECQV